MTLISMTSMYLSAINSGGAGVPQELSVVAKLSVDHGGTPMGALEAPLTVAHTVVRQGTTCHPAQLHSELTLQV